MLRTFKSFRSARGFSLLELMVAVAISLLLLMGVIALFVSSRSSYETTERLSRIQENGRFAIDLLASDVRAAGYQGCARPPGTSRNVDYAINTLNNSTSLLWNFAVSVQGFQGNGSAFSPTLDSSVVSLNPAPSDDADVLVVRIPRRDAVATYVIANQGSPQASLSVSNLNPAPFATGDTVVVTDCEARAWFQVTSYAAGVVAHAAGGASPGNSTDSLLHPFRSDAQIVPVDTVIYYLGQSTADPAQLSLWRKTGDAPNSDEIAEGIERLEVQYGIGTNGQVTSYVDASGVTNWDNVYTVQIALLARAPTAYGTDLDAQEHVLFMAPTRIVAAPANDRFQRKVFTATVALRNQIID